MLRILSAVVLIAIVGSAVWLLPVWAMAALAAVAAVLAGLEVAGMAGHTGVRVSGNVVGLAAAALVIAFWLDGGAGARGPTRDLVGAALAALVVCAGLVTLRSGPPAPGAFTRAAILVMGPVYVGIPLGAIVWAQSTAGPGATTWLVATMAISDSAQYYAGRRFGRTKLAPVISPAKTREGALAGLLAAAVTGWFAGPAALDDISAPVGLAIGVALAIVGMAGDLFESLLKRSAGVKDSSSMIPGHGGVLDRIDSYLFAAPVFYLLLRYVR